VSPVRDLLVAVFFVSVGMLLDPAVVVEHWGIILVLSGVVVAGNVIAVSSGVFLIGEGMRTAVQAGMSLAQIGEFSFIIASVGIATGATRDFLYPVAVAVCAVTTLLTPYLIQSAPRVAARVDARLPGALQTFVALYGSWIEQLRATPSRSGGRGRTRRLVRGLALDTLLLAILFIGLSVEFPRLVNRLDTLAWLNVHGARAVVLIAGAVLSAPLVYYLVRTTHLLGMALAVRALPTPEERKIDMARAPRRALEVTLQFGLLFAVVALLVAVTQPFAPRIPGVAVIVAAGLVLVLAIWRSAKNLHGHAIAGAEVIAAALAKRMSDGSTTPSHDAMTRMQAMLPGLGEPVALTVDGGSTAAGRTLADLDMRGVTGATVLAILHGEERIASPRGESRLDAGDTIAVAGTQSAVDAVREMVTKAATAPHPPEPV
jgi:CPA2 family monovalent cation:H+ antiporter-2